jgi:hypothetical protein
MNKMKVAILGSILIFLLSLRVMASFSAEPELGGGRISLVQGQVLIQTKDAEEWADASVNFPITDGDRIMTERDGRVELQLKNGTYVRAGEESQIDIIALSFDQGKSFIHLNQLEGKTYVNHHPITGEALSLYIDLPYGVLSAYVPSRFRVDLTSSEAKISVLEGSVEFNRDGRPIPLTQGKTLIAKEGGYAEVAQLYGRDAWDQWNEARDNELFQRRYVQKFIPPDLEPYGYEMEGNGRWVYTPEYQYVWVPTVVVGWAPFRYGHWAWRRGVYCWVPQEPWGWVPFHYGRWVYIHNHGWAWVPPFRHATIWHPGAVAWHISSTHVSWVPLAPGEIYYGHRYYGPHSVNINQVNINIQKNVYVNARVKDSVVTVRRDSFFRRNPVRITQAENPFLNPVKVSGPPGEKPVFLDGKKTPSRPIREALERAQPTRISSSKDWGRDIPLVERSPKVIDQRRFTEAPEKKTISEPVRNRVEGIERSNRPAEPPQGNLVKRGSPPVPTRERGRGENQALNQESSKNKNMPIVPPVMTKKPNDKEPKKFQGRMEGNVSPEINRDRFERAGQPNSVKENVERRNPIPLPPSERTRVESPNPVQQSQQRNASADVNQNRFGRAGQSNSLPSLLQRQEGKAFAGRPSLPERRLSPVPESRGQAIQPNRGSVGGFFGSSLMRSFR